MIFNFLAFENRDVINIHTVVQACLQNYLDTSSILRCNDRQKDMLKSSQNLSLLSIKLGFCQNFEQTKSELSQLTWIRGALRQLPPRWSRDSRHEGNVHKLVKIALSLTRARLNDIHGFHRKTQALRVDGMPLQPIQQLGGAKTPFSF